MRTKVVVAVTVSNIPEWLQIQGISGLFRMIDLCFPVWKDTAGNKTVHRFEKDDGSTDVRAGEFAGAVLSYDSWGKVVQVRFRTLDDHLEGHRLVAYKKWTAQFFHELKARLSLAVGKENVIHCTVEILQLELVGDTLDRTYAV